MPQDNSLSYLHRLVWTALMAALVAVGAFLYLPLGPVPISLQPFFVLMAGFILGPRWGAMALCLYVAAGLAGLPVFSGGRSGFAHLLGPTGGFLIGFIACAALAGAATARRVSQLTWLKGVLWGLAGLLALYLVGVLRLQMVIKADLAKAVTVGFAPFFPPDLAKLAAAVAVYRFLWTKRLLPR